VDNMLDVATLAKQTRMSPAWWRKRITRGEIPVVRLGRSVRIRESDVARFLVDRSREATG
jgi:excisionase family DNA binding protein